MDPIRQAIRTALVADAPLLALLAPVPAGRSDLDGVYPDRAPQEAATPFVVFQKLAGTPDETFTGTPLQGQVWQVKGIDRDDSASVVEDIDARIDVVLRNADLNITGYHHLFLRRESDVSYPESDGADTYHHGGGLYRLVVQRMET